MSDFQSLKNARKQREGQAPFVSQSGGTLPVREMKNTGSSEEEMKIDREDQALETANSSTSEGAATDPGDSDDEGDRKGALLDDELQTGCFGVGDGVDLKRCTGCKIVRYCTPACQTRDWTFHKHECNALHQWMKAASAESPGEARPPSDAIRCLGRILWRIQKLGASHIW
ncbi:hypothetical protein FA13DRAFT_1778853, partial [Coprinellus micaceus]